MRVILSVLHFANLRNYESVVAAMAERGHQVHLLAEESETFGGQALAERLAGTYSTVTWGYAPSSAGEPWAAFALKVRFGLDYVRFLADRYDDVPKLRLRNVERAPRLVRWMASGPGGVRVGHARTARLLMWLERRMPRSADLAAYLSAERPDVLVLTALTFSRSAQIEQLKAARGLGIRTAACILSWDHLSSKAPIHIAPDLTVVWNDVQRHEAVDMHGLPESRVVVTGAQCYDQWFERRPSRTREEFCAALGLDPGRRLILYVCSTMSPVPNPVEPVFVKEWVTAVRQSGRPELRDASIMVRPHPERVHEWKGVSLDGLDHVVLHGRSPIDAAAKADYFDSLYFCDAVVGLCTSAFLEAAIVGRPVLTVLRPEYRLHQDGMAHFRYLLTVGGGLLHTADDLSGHLEQLADAVRGRGERDARNRSFLQAFIRPAGLDVPSTPAFVDAIERLAGEPPSAVDPMFAAEGLAERAVARVAGMTRHGVGYWLMRDVFDEAEEKAEEEATRRKHDVVVERERERLAKAERTAMSLREKDRQRREKARQRRAKAFARWRRHVSPGKSVARLRRSVRQLIAPRSS